MTTTLVAIVVIAFFVLLFITEVGGEKNASLPEEKQDEKTPVHPPQRPHMPLHHYYDPYYPPGGPIFSPDRRQIWDGEKWVENETHLLTGMFIGVLLTIFIGFMLFR